MTTTEIAHAGAAAPEHVPYRPPRAVRYGATAGLLVLLIAFPLVFPNPTVTSIGVFTMIYLIGAIGWNIFSGFSGYISIGSAAYYGIGQYTVALITIHAHLPGGWGLFALLPVAGLVSALASIPIGFLLLRVRKHTFIVLTIAVMFILQLLAFNLTRFTNGSGGLTMPFPTWTGDFFNMPFYYAGLLAAVVAGAVAWWVRRSKYGLGLFAIRDDEERARGLGIKVTRTKLIAYAASAFFVGIAGGLYAPFVGSVYPQFAFDPTFDLAVAVLVFVGGIGTLSGPVLGALVLIPLQQYFYLQFGNANLYLIAYGVLFILILRLLPGGIVPGVTSAWRARLVARARARQEDAGQEDAKQKERVQKDTVEKDTVQKDTVQKGTVQKDARQDAGQKDKA